MTIRGAAPNVGNEIRCYDGWSGERLRATHSSRMIIEVPVWYDVVFFCHGIRAAL